MKRALAVILLVLLADQALKVWVKLDFHYEESRPLLGHRAQLHFIENPGMAFGMVLGGERGKLTLTLFRIVAVAGIGWWLHRMVAHGAPRVQVMGVALILAGALGNIIDSTFYGLVFSKSGPFAKAVLFPPEGGYAPLFHGAVVDMLYFPLWEGRLPDWLPLWGGRHFIFFQPVFNLADAAITVGVVLFILSHRKASQAVEGDDGTAGQPAMGGGPADPPAP